MPNRIDFYVLNEGDNEARLFAACRVIEKAWLANHQVYVHTDSPQQARQVDQLLWTFKQDSFVPHQVAPKTSPASVNEVIIGQGEAAPPGFEVLINVSERFPECYTEFDRVAEFVGATETSKSNARSRYRAYREGGCEIQSHNV